MDSRNAICFQGLQIYRDAVVRHIRHTLQHSYPHDWPARLRAPLQKEWEPLEEAAGRGRKTGEITTQLQDDFDLLSVNHFYNLFEAYYDILFPDDRISPDLHRQKRQNILYWAKAINTMRNVIVGHPGELEASEEDSSLMMLYCKRVADFISTDTSDALSQQRELLFNPTLTSIRNQPILESSTLPPRESIAPMFVGREKEISELQAWLSDPRSHTWLLAGDGGKGKTSIAYQFADSVAQRGEGSFEIVIWMSAKARKFESGIPVDIESPDFWDLDSALTWVLQAYGALRIDEMDIEQKEKECLQYLGQLPALIILDDVDSLEGQNISAMNFFMIKAQTTLSKVLLTSRRIPLGLEPTTTIVKGFDVGATDGLQFIDSRIDMYGLESSQFSKHIKDDIVDACDGSPLFIQDLLRLITILGEAPRNAISEWKKWKGEAARRHALGREFEKLSDTAKQVLLACALYPSPISLDEIVIVTKILREECHAATQELRSLFLLPAPSIIENIPRFRLNVNTSRLVLEVEGTTDRAQRIRSSIKAITQDIQMTPRGREIIGQYIRQAVSLVKLDRHAEAESTLQEALVQNPDHPDLYGSLGWVYKSWKPNVRYTDARNHFARASELKSTKEDMYRHWWELEDRQGEWTAAANAAEDGLSSIPSSRRLTYMAGRARSRLAQDLYAQTQYGRAKQEAQRAETHLKNALAELEDLRQGEYQLHGQILRANTINFVHLIRLAGIEEDAASDNHYMRLLASYLRRWEREHPDDPNMPTEKNRCTYLFPELYKSL